MDKKPNLLVILSDQLRRHALGCYGDPDARSPHIDKLSNDGVRFSNACSTYPICVPFRFTMMTGEYAHTRLVPGIEYRMSPRERTLADEFNEANYETIYVGKWHLDGGHGRLGSAKQTNRVPVPRSHQGRWQSWYGFELRNDPFDTCYFHNGDQRPIPIEGYQTDGLFDISMQHLTQRTDPKKPFCMLISVEPPHNPFEAPADYQLPWEEREIQLPPNFATNDIETRDAFLINRKRYNAMVENLDANIGRMRKFLEENSLDKNTIIVFLSDHGELGGAHGLKGKQWPYEESIGIPLVIYDPRTSEKPKKIIHDPTCTEDLFPTFLGLCGLESKTILPGFNLTHLLNETGSHLSREGVMLQYVAELRERFIFHDSVWRAFRTQRYKYVVRGDKNNSEPWMFFDLENDPYEGNNLVANSQFNEEKKYLHKLLRNRLLETEDSFVLSSAWGIPSLNEWRN